MPLSPPVINATLPCNRRCPWYEFSPWSGVGLISEVLPGISCAWAGNGGFGSRVRGSSVSVVELFMAFSKARVLPR
jgi:hypothetical protein